MLLLIFQCALRDDPPSLVALACGWSLQQRQRTVAVIGRMRYTIVTVVFLYKLYVMIYDL
jgi:hypothetical protein